MDMRLIIFVAGKKHKGIYALYSNELIMNISALVHRRENLPYCGMENLPFNPIVDITLSSPFVLGHQQNQKFLHMCIFSA